MVWKVLISSKVYNSYYIGKKGKFKDIFESAYMTEYTSFNVIDKDYLQLNIINNEDINVIMQNYKKNKKNYKTTPTLTKYERTRVLSERASQINDGSQALINIDKYN